MSSTHKSIVSGTGGLYGGSIAPTAAGVNADGTITEEAASFEFNAPINFGNMFGGDSDDDAETVAAKQQAILAPQYDIQTHSFPHGHTLKIRQFDDHITNANAVWPESRFLAGWLCGEGPNGEIDQTRLESLLIKKSPSTSSTAAATSSASRSTKRVLELGAGCGASAIYFRLMGVDITASDIDDPIVTSNIEFNAKLNEAPQLHLLPHTWGKELDHLEADMKLYGGFDVIIASDILNYEKEFESLVQTLDVLMPRGPSPSATSSAATTSSSYGSPTCIFYMVWKRRSKGTDQQNQFFQLLQEHHYRVETEGQKVFQITRLPLE